MQSTVKPSPIALVVCDTIYQEPGGKLALVGLFNGVVATQFPAGHARLAVFASATGVRPNSHAKIEIVHAENETRVVVSAEGPFPVDANPLSIVDLSFIFNNLVFPEAGTYYVRFWGNNNLLLMRPFQVAEAKKQEPKNDNS